MNKQDYQQTLDYITDNVKLLDVIEKYGLKLRKESDDRYVMVCPFHAEDTASLKIYQNQDGKWTFFCFGCSAGYGVIDFIKLYEGISFMDVINRYKIKVNQSSSEDLYQRIVDFNNTNTFNLSQYMSSSQFRLGVYLREYLKEHADKTEFVDARFHEMDDFFEDVGNLNKEKIDYFEDLILEKVANEL